MTDTPEQPLIKHLLELRNRIMKAVASVLVVFICMAYWSKDIYHYAAIPILKAMPASGNMIATDVTAPFFAPFKLTLVLAFFIAIPYILFQIWSFIAPGLYKHEKKLVYPLLMSSTLLFYAGIVFSYYAVFPIVFNFFANSAPEGINIAPDINRYLDFVLKMFFGFGIAFEIPIAVILMCWAGVTTPKELVSKRPYIIVMAFVVAMFLTPPDVLSQSMLAIPMLLLFELGLFATRFYKPREREDDDEDEDEVEEQQ